MGGDPVMCVVIFLGKRKIDSKTYFLIDKYGTKRTHPNDKAITALTYSRYNKKRKIYSTNKRETLV